MLNILKTRLSMGSFTAPLPGPGETPVPEGFRGLPRIEGGKCAEGCSECVKSCPTQALFLSEGGPRIDLGRCLFCPDCALACPRGLITFTRDHRLGATKREDLIIGPGSGPPAIEPLKGDLGKLFGRSLKLRQVSAAGCNGCEAELIVTGTLVFDLGRFGVQFSASPRHADALVVTGPVSANMKLALLKTFDALPAPKLVIACGACATSGGIFRGNEEVCDGPASVLPVDLWIPGCPPHPWTLVDSILRLIGRL